MCPQNKASSKDWHIYALISPNGYAYIGKTASSRISAIYSAHLNGKYKQTQKYFDHINAPHLYLLEAFHGIVEICYKHLLAWVSVFMDTGYILLNYEKTLDQALDLHPDTQLLADRIRAEPLDTILRRAYVTKPSDADRKPQPVSQKKGLEIQDKVTLDAHLSIRITKKDKDTFLSYCDRMGMGQRDAFLYALHQHTDAKIGSSQWLADQSVKRFLRDYQKKIQALEEENEKFKKHVKQLSDPDGQPGAIRATDQIQFIKDGVSRYFREAETSLSSPVPLVSAPYKKFMRSLPEGVHYDYPEQDGFFLFQPEGLLWGSTKPPVLFVLGHTPDGERIRIRCYNKPFFVGISFLDDRFAFRSARFLVGCRKANDGAMDLYFAFPLDAKQKNLIPNTVPELVKDSLAQRITNIERKLLLK